MPHSYSTHTFVSVPSTIPAFFGTLEDFKRFADDPTACATNSPAELCDVRGSTRSGWAVCTIKSLVESGGFSALQFLTDKGHSYQFETESGYTGVAILEPKQQAPVIAELTRLLSELSADPDAAYDAEEFGIYCEGDVEAALARDYVCANPAFDAHVLGDDGQSADYLFVYLFSILVLAKNARAQGLAIVHVLEI
jgi:hypothetical protein